MMLQKLINISKFLYNTKIRFDLPIQKDIVQYDELNAISLKKIIKKDFNILPTRNRKIYFWIFIKQIINFDFTFKTYIANYIKFTSAKILITLIDNDLAFYNLKNYLKNTHLISIQNGIRLPYTSMFKNKKYIKSKILKCDHLFVFNKYYIKKYQNIIESKYHVLGNYKNNMVKIKKTKIKNSFIYISHYKKGYAYRNSILKSLNLLDLYFFNKKRKFNILLKASNSDEKNDEINYYKKILKSNYNFLSRTIKKNSHNILDEFENIIFSDSTLGYEAVSRKKKVAVFALNKKKFFGWPAPFKKNYNFFCSKKLTYNEVERVLENVYNCSENNWKKKYYKIIKDQVIINKDNTILRKVINDILNSYK